MEAELYATGIEPEVLRPTTMSESIEVVLDTIHEIMHTNQIMIELYIHSNTVPMVIAAYKPALEKLAARVDSLGTIDVPSLTLVMDMAEAFIASSLLAIVSQLINAARGIHQIWTNHYDRGIEQRKPYDRFLDVLNYKSKQLNNVIDEANNNPNRRPVEALMPTPDPFSEPSFCKGAVACSNGRNNGKMVQVMSEDLTVEEKARVRNQSGAYLWWECNHCAFRLKYYAPTEQQSSVYSTDDFRSHGGGGYGDIEYRGTWLIKCHLYLDKSKVRGSYEQGFLGGQSMADRKGSQGATRRPSIRQRSRSDADAAARKETGGRGKTYIGNSKVGLFTINRSASNSRSTNNKYYSSKFNEKGSGSHDKSAGFNEFIFDPQAVDHRHGLVSRYGCPFCFVIGASRGRMNYVDEIELCEHIANKHARRDRLPCSLILARYQVGINGKCSPSVRRWDLNIKTAF